MCARRFARFSALSAILSATGCAGFNSTEQSAEADNSDEQQNALINESAPPKGPVASTLSAIGSGRAPQLKSDGSTLVLGGTTINASITDGRDLTAGATTDRDAFIAAAVGDAYSTPSGFGASLASTVDHANSHAWELDSGALGSLYSWMDKIGGGVEVSIGETENEFTGYSPERARWLSASLQSSSSGTFIKKTYYYDEQYPAPQSFDEIQERGARLYCAAREAQRRQVGGSTVTGSLSAASFSILGKKIDLLVVEPTTVVNGPTKIAEAVARDGQQAFEVPMLMGTRITPIRGIGLGALDEIRYPVVLSTADSEVETPTEMTWVRNGYYLENRPKKTYRTVTHVDGVTVAHKQMSASKRIDFVHSPVVDLGLTITLAANIGNVNRSNERVIDMPYDGAGTGWPSEVRKGDDRQNPFGVVAYHDGKWRWDKGVPGEIGHIPATWNVLAEYPMDPDVSLGTDLISIAMDKRLQSDDDHALSTSTALRLTGEISGSAKYPVVGPFSIGVSGSAGLGGTVQQEHVFLDAIQLQRLYGDFNLPAAGVTIRPRTTGSFDFTGGKVNIIFSVSLPIVGNISRELTLFRIDPKTIASFNTDDSKKWPENSSLRLGTASGWGNTKTSPMVGSHVPNGYDYGSFDSADVPTCLADESPNPPIPPACGGAPTEGEPINANICVAKPVSGNADICSNIEAHVMVEGATPEQRDCLRHYYEFLCEPVHHTQLAGSPLYGTTGHLSHLTNVSDPGTMTRLADIQNQCVAAFVDLSGDESTRKAKAKAYLDSQFTFTMCDDGAVPSPGGSLTLDPAGPPVGEAPELEPSAPCP